LRQLSLDIVLLCFFKNQKYLIPTNILRKKIHIINPFENASGGNEWRALTLYEHLKSRSSVYLWAVGSPDPRFSNYPIRTIDPYHLNFPKSGTFIFVGIYFFPGKWIRFSFPKRTVVIFNTLNLRRGLKFIKSISGFFLPQPDFEYACQEVANEVGIPGVVHASPISLTRFTPCSNGEKKRPDEQFVVGRLSRDTDCKHHPHDPVFYRQLADQGFRIRIMGGRCLQTENCDHSNIELLPACSQPSEIFLQGIDVFFYRTDPKWYETFGRVIFEAMACGLPVVVENRGGYRDHIVNGKNGFLFNDQNEALAILNDLKKNPSLRARIGLAARKTVEKMYSEERILDYIQFFLR
jgi:glycosyltransferase involved in cell wall biosynthesis